MATDSRYRVLNPGEVAQFVDLWARDRWRTSNRDDCGSLFYASSGRNHNCIGIGSLPFLSSLMLQTA